MEEKVILEEARNVARHWPVFPGDTLSHASAYECARRGWIRRDSDGNWRPTLRCPWTVVTNENTSE